MSAQSFESRASAEPVLFQGIEAQTSYGVTSTRYDARKPAPTEIQFIQPDVPEVSVELATVHQLPKPTFKAAAEQPVKQPVSSAEAATLNPELEDLLDVVEDRCLKDPRLMNTIADLVLHHDFGLPHASLQATATAPELIPAKVATVAVEQAQPEASLGIDSLLEVVRGYDKAPQLDRQRFVDPLKDLLEDSTWAARVGAGYAAEKSVELTKELILRARQCGALGVIALGELATIAEARFAEREITPPIVRTGEAQAPTFRQKRLAAGAVAASAVMLACLAGTNTPERPVQPINTVVYHINSNPMAQTSTDLVDPSPYLLRTGKIK